MGEWVTEVVLSDSPIHPLTDSPIERTAMTRRALLIIDMLNDFIDPRGALYCGEQAREIVPVIGALAGEFRAAGEPVIYLCDAHTPDDKEFELFAPHAVKGTWGSQVIPGLAPAKDSLVLDKTRFSAFYRTGLASALEKLAPGEVWVTGVCTSICVMDTTGDLRNRDYSAVIPADAVADFDLAAHRFALDRMKRIYGARLIAARHGEAGHTLSQVEAR
jgi:nicotinamidase/pyrazinamidase